MVSVKDLNKVLIVFLTLFWSESSNYWIARNRDHECNFCFSEIEIVTGEWSFDKAKKKSHELLLLEGYLKLKKIT